MSYRSASDRYGLTKLYPPIQFVDNGKTIVFESEHMISDGSLDGDLPYHCFPICFIDSNNVIHLAWSRTPYHSGPGGQAMYQRVYHNGTSWVIETPRWISPELASEGDVNNYGIRKIFETSDGAICLTLIQRHPTDNRTLFYGAKSFNGGDSFEPVNPADSLLTDYYWTIDGPCHAILQNGYWIAPVFGKRFEGDSYRSGAAYGTPKGDGLHWTRLGTFGPAGVANYEENGVIQRPDKLLIGISRTDELEGLHFSFSPNGGRAFSLPVAKSVPSIAKPEFVVTPNGTIFGYGRYSLDGGTDDSPDPNPTGPNYWRTIKIISTDGGGTFSYDWADNRQYDPGNSNANANQYGCGVWHPVLQKVIIFYGVSHGSTPYNGDGQILMHVLREEDV